MRLFLTRTEYRADGVIGELRDESGKVLAVTLEHSYDGKPKLPDGVYACMKGKHQLHSMRLPFETFEITGVPNHQGILLHMGNWNADSDGCVLLGEKVAESPEGVMVTSSIKTFTAFMAMMSDLNDFELVVS